MSFKEQVSQGEDLVVEQVDRGFAGARKTIFQCDGDNGDVLIGLQDANGNAPLKLPGDGTFPQLAAGNHQTLSGAGAVDPNAPVTLFTSTGAAQALTLADGSRAGQRKRIYHSVDGGSGVLTPAHLADGTSHTITFTAVGDWVDLCWSTVTLKWHVCAISSTGLIA